MAFLDVFKPKWKNSNPTLRRMAIERITKLSVLKKIVLTEEDKEIVTIAIGKITDCKVLYSIVQKCQDSKVIKEIITKIKDQKLLYQIAKYGDIENTRIAATKLLTDQDFLIDLVHNDESHYVRRKAAEKISNVEKIIDVYNTEVDSVVKTIIIDNLKDINHLNKLYQNETSKYYKKHIIKAISDNSTIIDLLRFEKSHPYLDLLSQKIVFTNEVIEAFSSEKSYSAALFHCCYHNDAIKNFIADTIKNNPIENENFIIRWIDACYKNLSINSKEKRLYAITSLIQISQISPIYLLDKWEKIKEKINKPQFLNEKEHYDRHVDWKSHGNCSAHNDHNDVEKKQRVKIEINKIFPEFPPNLKDS